MRFLFLFLAALAALSGIYLTAAVTINPYGDFNSSRFPVVLLGDRYAKMHLFENFKANGPVDGVILGSNLDHELLSGRLSARVSASVLQLRGDQRQSRGFSRAAALDGEIRRDAADRHCRSRYRCRLGNQSTGRGGRLAGGKRRPETGAGIRHVAARCFSSSDREVQKGVFRLLCA